MTNVRALLSMPGRFGHRGFRLKGLFTALDGMSPSGVTLCFRLVGGEVSLLLECTFGGVHSSRSCDLLRERLLRGEVLEHFDCTLLGESAVVTTPPRTLRMAPPESAILPSGNWIALPVTLLDVAADLFDDALAQGYDAAYAIVLRRDDANRALAKRLVKAAAETGTRGSQRSMHEALSNGLALLSRGGWLADESLRVPEAYAPVAEALAERGLRRRYPFLPPELWACLWDGLPPRSDALLVHERRDDGFLQEVLERITPSRADDPPLPSPRPAPVVAGDYVFVSYAHADRDYAAAVIDRLQRSGVAVWFDAGIEAGARWDEALEQRLRECAALVACVTGAYEASRYCRRELKFADLLQKAIFPVAAMPHTWGSGLQLMFQELQIGTYRDGRGVDELRTALERSCPQVCRG